MQKTHENGVITYVAGGTVAAGNLVKFSSGTVIKTTAATDCAVGIALDGAASGEEVPVKILGAGGTASLLAGGEIRQGVPVTANATATTTNATSVTIIGYALEAASAAGDVIEIATCQPIVK